MPHKARRIAKHFALCCAFPTKNHFFRALYAGGERVMMVYLQCYLLGIDLKEHRSVRIYGSEVKDQ